MPAVDAQQFAEVMALHELQVPAEQVQQLVRYCELLWEWNEKINLTRHTTIEKF